MAAPEFLLDTGVVLHATRQRSPVSAALDQQFALSASRFRPAICEVSVGELLAFSRAWGERRKTLLKEQIRKLLVMPISHPGIHECFADVSSAMRDAGSPVGHNDMWIAATALVTGFTVLTVDRDFLRLRDACRVRVILVDNRTGIRMA
jgi:predicted nucleic acid-binding protein